MGTRVFLGLAHIRGGSWLQAVDSWFIKVEHLRERLWKNTEQTYWVPEKVSKSNKYSK